MQIYTDLRDKRRFECEAEISHDNLLPGLFYAARMLNFSKGGLFFESHQSLYIGDYINIKIEYLLDSSTDDVQHNFGVEILWRQDLQDSPFKYGYGAQYIDPNESLEKIFKVANLTNKRSQVNELNDKKDPRRYPRRPYNKSLPFTSKKRQYTGLITNLSRGGAFIETQNKFSVGQVITLMIPGYRKPQDIKLKASVVRLGVAGIGVIFDRRKKHRNRRSDLDRRTGADRRTRRRRRHLPGRMPAAR
jgi:Tfp pilus assembly protein PilZ